MISYINGNQEAIITSISDKDWTVCIYDSFESFRNCKNPLDTKTFVGTPNRTQMLQYLPGWIPRVRDPQTWNILSDSDDDLPPLPSVPTNITARQIRLWLVQNNFQLFQIDNAINTIEDSKTREIVKIEWEYAPYIERSHQWLVPLAQSLGLNEEQIDQAFREASLI